MDSLKKYKTEILLAGSALAAGLAIYYFFKKGDNEEHAEASNEPAPLSKLAKANIIASIKVNYSGNFLTIETVQSISESLIKFARPNFTQLTHDERRRRRALRNNLKEYVQSWDEFIKELEHIIDDANKEVLRALVIHHDVWEESNKHYVGSSNDLILNLHAELPQKLKQSLTGSKKITLPQLKEALKRQIDGLQKESKDIEEVKKHVKSEEVFSIVQNLVHDYVFEKCGLEEEDIVPVLNNFLEEPEIKELIRQIHDASLNLMTDSL